MRLTRCLEGSCAEDSPTVGSGCTVRTTPRGPACGTNDPPISANFQRRAERAGNFAPQAAFLPHISMI